MFTFHPSSHLSSRAHGRLALCWILLAMTFAAQAQTKASCTFQFFLPTTEFKLHNGTPVFIQSSGINDFGTIVGYANPGTARGLIRRADGAVTHVKGTSFLRARNDHGTSVGLDLTDQGVLVNGSTITLVVLDVNNGGVSEVNGINNSGTIVGVYATPDFSSSHGFKRFKNGTTHTLDFPGALPGSTEPDGINDVGVVVGSYFAPDNSVHGFIFHNGQWATLDYPHATATVLLGITDAGKIIGNAFFLATASTTLFLYENGTFKVISVPNLNPGTGGLRSMSPKRGLILGVTSANAGDPAFIAQCH